MEEIFNRAIISKICHDLITPASAISNGFEILNTVDPADTYCKEINQLLNQSIETLTNKLVIYRACYGKNAIHILKNSESFRKTISSFYKNQKIIVSEIKYEAPCNDDLLLILMNLLVVATDVLQAGSECTINIHGDGFDVFLTGKFYSEKLPLFLQIFDGNNETNSNSNDPIDSQNSKTIAFFILQQMVAKITDKIFLKTTFDQMNENICTGILIKCGNEYVKNSI